MNIATIDKNLEFQEKIKNQFSNYYSHKLVLSADSVDNFLSWYHPYLNLDVILLDINLLNEAGRNSINQLKSQIPNAKIIVLTEEEGREKIIKTLQDGAVGILQRDPFPNWKNELRIIEDGGSLLSPNISKLVIEYFQPKKQEDDLKKYVHLSPKEKIVLKYILDGFPNKMIAEKMEVSINTVFFHNKNIFKKFEVNSKIKLLKRKIEGKLYVKDF